VRRRQADKPIAESDAPIVTIAQSRGTVLANRNAADFQGCGIDGMNPWDQG
jgi:hypothetical protein